MKHFRLQLETYPTDVLFFKKEKHFLNYAQSCYYSLVLPDTPSVGLCALLPNRQEVLVLVSKRKELSVPELVEVISHECYHATDFVVQVTGAEFNIGCEFRAYLFNMLQRAAINFYIKGNLGLEN